jgi:hypothetical protein
LFWQPLHGLIAEACKLRRAGATKTPLAPVSLIHTMASVESLAVFPLHLALKSSRRAVRVGATIEPPEDQYAKI